MPRTSPPSAALVAAAQELEDGLRRFEEAVADAARTRLNSEKNIGRAARLLQEAAAHHEGLGERVSGLLAAIREAEGRSGKAVEQMQARAGELQARVGEREVLRGRGDEIAAEVRGISALVKEGAAKAQILERLAAVEERVVAVLKEVRAADFDDVTHDIDGLRQMLATMRRKLKSP